MEYHLPAFPGHPLSMPWPPLCFISLPSTYHYMTSCIFHLFISVSSCMTTGICVSFTAVSLVPGTVPGTEWMDAWANGCMSEWMHGWMSASVKNQQRLGDEWLTHSGWAQLVCSWFFPAPCGSGWYSKHVCCPQHNSWAQLWFQPSCSTRNSGQAQVDLSHVRWEGPFPLFPGGFSDA